MKYDVSATKPLLTEGGFADRGTDESGKGFDRDGTEDLGQGLRGLASDYPADGSEQWCRSGSNRESDESHGGAGGRGD